MSTTAPYYRPAGAARLLGISRQRLHGLIRAGHVDCTRTRDGDVLLSEAQVAQARQWVTSHRMGRPRREAVSGGRSGKD